MPILKFESHVRVRTNAIVCYKKIFASSFRQELCPVYTVCTLVVCWGIFHSSATVIRLFMLQSQVFFKTAFRCCYSSLAGTRMQAAITWKRATTKSELKLEIWIYFLNLGGDEQWSSVLSPFELAAAKLPTLTYIILKNRAAIPS